MIRPLQVTRIADMFWVYRVTEYDHDARTGTMQLEEGPFMSQVEALAWIEFNHMRPLTPERRSELKRILFHWHYGTRGKLGRNEGIK